ncbi:MAG: DUF533 domain-containing protein [Planctomycetes bacterium]|nr:DUF533 domain-containing protein [Planctomycetota bacterium]
MDQQNQKALLVIALLAARADGGRDEREREAIRGALQRIRGEGLDPEALWSEVEAGGVDLARTARELTTSDARELAYEIATCVCGADRATSEKERLFLEQLAQELGLAPETADRFRSETDSLTNTSLSAGGAGESEVDEQILRQAILCGGLELLPQRLATLAILPLQMRLVYQVGKRHGFEVDRGHVKEFLGVLGVGMASQMIEGFARQFLSSFLGRAGGGMLGGLAGSATSVGFSFATTYALGHAAKRYYASGRKLTPGELKGLFGELVGRARELQPRHASDIAASARAADMGSLQRLLAI